MSFIRYKAIHSNKKGKLYVYAYLVQSVWNKEKKQAQQKVVKYIGKTQDMNQIITKNIFSRDNYQCLKCRTTENLTIDYKIPIKNGGTNEENNLQTLCMGCNQKKSDKIEQDIEIKAI